ncbi:RDD family protein [Bacillus tianshenii]|uniref:RDD family protein n=1 Tax=Sutcliffiella tianshenii TaxID=1463404 RepID=UPI001CD7D94B|nr:RDD family protein [Bacillus tianshenii]MCA1321570.1 RDD family protein [Bacillus tianshenii]
MLDLEMQKKMTLYSDPKLRVYQLTGNQDKKAVMMRTLLGQNATEQQIDDWFETYDHYQLTVTNYKYLPRVISVNYGEDEDVYSVLEYEEGSSLTQHGELGKEHVEQLVDALDHLHRKGVVHGSVTPDNIWVTEKDRIVLYGAGEWKALGRPVQTFMQDINSLIGLLLNYAVVSDSAATALNQTKITSLGQVSDIFLNGGDVKTKGSLVEKSTKGSLVEKEAEQEFLYEKRGKPSNSRQEPYYGEDAHRETPRTNIPRQEPRVEHRPLPKQHNNVYDIHGMQHATYIGFWRRFFAYFIDGLILGIPASILFGDGGNAVVFLLGWIYFGAMESSGMQATLGKRMLGMKVVDKRGYRLSFGHAVGRHFAKIISYITLCIGFLIVGLDEKKRALHDHIAGTLVISNK